MKKPTTVELMYKEFGPKIEKAYEPLWNLTNYVRSYLADGQVIGVEFLFEHTVIRIPIILVQGSFSWWILEGDFLSDELVHEIDNFDMP